MTIARLFPDYEVAVLTVIPTELRAVREALGLEDSPIKSDSGSHYWLGSVRSELRDQEFSVALGCIGHAGNYDSAAATLDVIETVKPRFVILVGIAAGIEGKVRIGETVLSDRVVAYEPAAQREAGMC